MIDLSFLEVGDKIIMRDEKEYTVVGITYNCHLSYPYTLTLEYHNSLLNKWEKIYRTYTNKGTILLDCSCAKDIVRIIKPFVEINCESFGEF